MKYRVIHTVEVEAESPQEAANKVHEAINNQWLMQFEVYPLYENGDSYDHPFIIQG
jgi:hypothetical protein